MGFVAPQFFMTPVSSTGSHGIVWLRRRRALTQDPWFWSFLVFLITIISGGIALFPKVWRSTPAHVAPVIRISGLDVIQAQSLSRTAHRMESEGNLPGAAKAWFTAISNHPGDASLHEGLLNLVLGQAKPDLGSLTLAVSSAHWLLRLSGTNEHSLQLAAGVLSKAGLHDEVWNLLNPAHRTASLSTDRILAITAFETDRFDVFSQIWSRNEDAFRKDRRLQLYHHAWLSIWGPLADSSSALKSVEQACQTPDQAVAALRLKLIIYSQRVDPAAFDDAFNRLKVLEEARIQDHVRYWLFHAYLGNHDKAKMAARSANLTPVSVMEATLLINGWNQLGLTDLIAGFARKQLPNFPSALRLHLQVARTLLAAKRWEDIHLLSAMIRANPRLSRPLGGYADFLAGRSALGLGHPSQARDLFQKLTTTHPEDPALGFEIAKELVGLGYSDSAVPLLKRLEQPLSASTNYWKICGAAANAVREEGLLVSATRRALALSPRDNSLTVEYGYALAVSRREPTECLRITLEAASRAPKSPLANLCRALALSQTGRFADALQLLEKVSPESLSPDLRNQWWLCRFESEIGLGKTDMAQAAMVAIHRSALFPSQRDWLTRVQSRKTLVTPAP